MVDRIGHYRNDSCPRHEQNVLCFFCDTCSEAICLECSIVNHIGHNYLLDVVTNAKDITARLLTDAKLSVKALKEGIENSQHMSENIEVRSQAVANEVRETTLRHMVALEERERDLLRHVEKVRQVKAKSLHLQITDLKQGLSSLKRTVGRVENMLNTGTDKDSINAREIIVNELQNVRKLRSHLQPHEDDNIMFTPPDAALYNAISKMGIISSSAYAPNCIATSDGLKNAFKGNVSICIIHAKDHHGESRMIGGDPVECIIQNPEGALCRTEVLDLQNGTYAISHCPQREGKHIMSITIRGKHIADSPFVVQVNSGRNYMTVGQLLLQFGREGEEEGTFCRPWGACCHKDNYIIVADQRNNRVQVFNPDGTLHRRFGSTGTRHGQFDRPAGVACDLQGNVVVADKDNHRIQKFTIQGNFLITFGEKGNKNGQFNYPWDVAVNSEGKLLVSDSKNHRVQLFSAEGQFLNKYGYEESLYKLFDSPRGVCFNNEGHMVVTDFTNHCVHVIDPDFQGERIFRPESSDNGQLRPQGVIVDRQGNIIVTDSENHRIQVFEPNCKFMCKFGTPGTGPGQMDRPSGICLTPEGLIVVVDFGNNRVQLF